MKMRIFMNEAPDPGGADLESPEWLLASGDGGFAFGTWSGLGSRSYHGLWVAPFTAPKGRRLLLSHVDETWRPLGGAASGQEVSTSSQLFRPGVVHPDGWCRLETFRAEPGPQWIWRVGETRIARRLELERRGRGAVLSWEWLSGPALEGRISFFLSGRSFHGDCDAAAPGPVELGEDSSRRALWTWSPDEPPIEFQCTEKGRWDRQELEYENFWRREEERRGYGATENLHAPLALSLTLDSEDHVMKVEFGERGRTASSLARPAPAGHRGERLRRAVGQPVVRRPNLELGILAGYPWFGEWGRDTMIAVPGVVLAARRVELAFEILDPWVARLNEGLLPNRLRETVAGALDNSADASLFFVRALALIERMIGCEALGRATPPRKQLIALRERYLKPVEEIVWTFHCGTRQGIGVDPQDGLLVAGNSETQLTWMDAQVDGCPVTPRGGKCVELNAMMYGAARLLARWCPSHPATSKLGSEARSIADRIRSSFEAAFWNGSQGYLNDLVPESRGDRLARQLRPNQLFALAEPGLISSAAASRALRAIDRSLTTRAGIRTLAPEDPDYQPRCLGDQATRDAAYHQGTIWPWLTGVYVDAISLHGAVARDPLRLWVDGQLDDLDRGVLGSISEILDAEAPHRIRGAPAQAWSAAELFRARDQLSSGGNRVQ